MGSLVCAAIFGLFLEAAPAAWALMLHLVVAPLVFAGVSWRYFRTPRPFPNVPVGLAFAAAALVSDLALAGVAHRRHAVDLPARWGGFVLIFALTCVTGALISGQPWKSRP